MRQLRLRQVEPDTRDGQQQGRGHGRQPAQAAPYRPAEQPLPLQPETQALQCMIFAGLQAVRAVQHFAFMRRAVRQHLAQHPHLSGPLGRSMGRWVDAPATCKLLDPLVDIIVFPG